MSKWIFLAFLALPGCGAAPVSTPAEILPILEEWKSEGIAHGFFEVNYGAIEFEFTDIRSAAGSCEMGLMKNRKIKIDRSRWNSSDDLFKKIVIWHELGHCFFGMEHSTNPMDIMFADAAVVRENYLSAAPYMFENYWN